jgi:hypothetical protein
MITHGVVMVGIDRAVGDAEVPHAVEPQLRVNDREVVPAHLCGAGRVVHRHRPVPDQVVQGLALERSRQNFALDERPHRLGISELAGDLHAPAQGGEIARISQHVGADFRCFARVCRFQPQKPAAFRPH